MFFKVAIFVQKRNLEGQLTFSLVLFVEYILKCKKVIL